ncbi:MAG: circularly permuted type 2 ATP-grasp protein [Verrucomicrobiales bacterium]|nr:circularly permuted type 2 ATP-grasp protein [Verrucomicrobiales bacterium]
MSPIQFDDRITNDQIMDSIGYTTLPGRRDEAVGEDGLIRPEWQPLFESISRHGTSELPEWRTVANRISRKRGLAYRLANPDPSGDDGWSLDPIPWIIGENQWHPLQSGISQRIRLYGEILKDAYGEQRILSEKLLPAEILLGHTGFVRSLHDLTPSDSVIGIGMSAFDVTHDNAGRPFVVNDRFDCPFGLGLALENRTVVNQVLPRLFRRCGVKRIGKFFADWFEFLRRSAPEGVTDPLVVILDSSGEEEESEIGFLANYCGVLRVHPSDLTARGGRVWIKALRGLVPVDVIWKTDPGKTIDSLEAEIRGHVGVAGIFEAMRIGGVTLASHPGTEILQSPGLYPYLPQLCRKLLGEELEIPPVASWWCGQTKALSHVIENLSSMVIKSVGHHRDFRTVYGSRLDEAGKEALRARIQANPAGFVGQEELAISSVPTSRGETLTPRGSVLRMFGFLDGEEGPKIMPGGLARVSTREGFVISTRSEGESKDVWVRTASAPEPFSISSVLDRSLPAAPDIVPSRTGENLYWTGRYAERAHVAAKFAARIIVGRNRGYSHDEKFEQRHEDLLLSCLFRIFDCEASYDAKKTADARLELVLKDRDCHAGISFNLERLRYATQVTKESWSPASILSIESCLTGWRSATLRARSHSGFRSELDDLQLHLSAFLGLNLDSMTRDEGWALLDAGRRIERGSTICKVLSFLLECEEEGDMSSLLNESILYILDSVRTYQRRYHALPETAHTMELLIGERNYHRALLQILNRLHEDLEMLPPPSQREHVGEHLREEIGELEQFILQMTGEIESGLFQQGPVLACIERLEESFASISDHLTVSYFSHAAEA